jgi:hypothetical protein
MEPRVTRVEVWPIAADPVGIWLVDDDAWRSMPLTSDIEPHDEVELLLAGHGARYRDVALLHSTSWRVDGPGLLLTYIALVRAPGLVLSSWPDALPLSPHLCQGVGRPPGHAATERPFPRDWDVLFHAVRHLAWLADTDDTAREAMGPDLLEHVAFLAPALSGMYRAT